MTTTTDLLLFDYGGVLLELDDPRELFGIEEDRATFSERWLTSPAVRAHETGKIGPQEFGRLAIRELGLHYSPEAFLERFSAWPRGVSAATAALVRSIPAGVDCAILSNTNPLHWNAQFDATLFDGRIGKLFLSYETGCMKPDPQAFRQVIDAVDCVPGHILFIDDSRSNVAAARREGLRAQHCANVGALAGILCDEGLVAQA